MANTSIFNVHYKSLDMSKWNVLQLSDTLPVV